MPLPTCQCVAGLPIGEQLAAIYCATYTLAAGSADGPYLLKSANLSDVANKATSFSNLTSATATVSSNGVVPSAATYPKVIAYPTSGTPQTLAEDDATIIAFGTEIQDTAGIWDGTSATIPTNGAGNYQLTITGLYLGNGATGAGDAILIAYVNGSQTAHISKTHEVLTSGKVYVLEGSVDLVLAANDVVTVRVFHGTGAGWQITNNGLSFTNRISISRIF